MLRRKSRGEPKQMSNGFNKIKKSCPKDAEKSRLEPKLVLTYKTKQNDDMTKNSRYKQPENCYMDTKTHKY